MRRLTKEYVLDVCDSMTLKYGTINRDNPQVIYVSGKCWIKPLVEMDYATEIESIGNNFKKNVKNVMTNDENFGKRFILDFDINSDKITLGEKKFLSFDFYIKQNEASKRPLKSLQSLFSRRVGLLARNLVESLQKSHFSVSKKK